MTATRRLPRLTSRAASRRSYAACAAAAALLMLMSALPAAADAEDRAAGDAVVINFDDLPLGNPWGGPVSTQYPEATFSSPAGENRIVTVSRLTASQPNYICVDGADPDGYACRGATVVSFPSPVDALSFNAIGFQNNESAQVEVYEDGTLSATVPLVGHNSSLDHATPERQDLSAYHHVTKIVVRTLNTSVVGWDDFAFVPQDPAPACGAGSGADDFPRDFSASGNAWKMQGEITDDDGIVLRDLKLKSRYVAASVAVPYTKLRLSGADPLRLELEHTASDPGHSCLTDFSISEPATRDEPLVISASYLFGDIEGGTLIVDQRYEFYREVDEGEEDPSLHCEPSDEAPWYAGVRPFPIACARWRPLVTYQFLPAKGQTLEDFEVVQRLKLRPDGRNLRGVALMRDCEPGEGGTLDEPCWIPTLPFGALRPKPDPGSDWPYANAPGIRMKDGDSALGRETLENVIVGGHPNAAAPYDNIHLTNRSAVDLPTPVPPGCPECLHFHWRWSAYFGGPQFGAGNLLIPKESEQDVTVAVLNDDWTQPDPLDFRALFDPGQELGATLGGPVLWHAATGHANHDGFFSYGGFVSSLEPWSSQPADLELTALQPTLNANKLSYQIAYQNNGPTNALLHRVVLTLPLGVRFNEEKSSPMCAAVSGRAVLCEWYDPWQELRPVPGTPGDGETYVVADVTDSTRTQFTARAEIRALNPDPNDNNNVQSNTICTNRRIC